MVFLAILIVYGVIQFGDGGRALQRDEWFYRWSQWVETLGLPGQELRVSVTVLGPVLALALALNIVEGISSWLLLLCAVPLLLYSLGRSELSSPIHEYVAAYRRNDNVAATEIAVSLGVEVDDDDGWWALHRGMLQAAGYLGFERLFAVLFWFILLGPVGAVLYRLLALACENQDSTSEMRHTAARALWLMEWPAVRVLGLSFALSGNFVGCFNHWREELLGYRRSTACVLETAIHGALNVNSTDVTQEDITEKELEALLPLLSRTMILWLCILAIVTIVA